MNQAQAMYRLQQTELTILRAQKRIDEIQEALENDAAMQQARQQLDDADAVLKPLRAQQRDLDHQIQSTLDKRKTTEERLYSGNVKNPKELSDMQQEIESLGRWHKELEDRLLETMLEVDEAQEAYDAAEANLEAVTREVEAKQSELIKEKNTLQSEIDAQKEIQSSVLPLIHDENKKRYNRLKPRKANQPVSLLNGTTCTVCGVAQIDSVVQEVRRGEDIITCKNCGRILVYIR